MPNEHPPIPPNHQKFRSALVWGEEHEEGFFYTISGWQRIRSLSGMLRGDCANSARCAWIEKAESLESKTPGEVMVAYQYADAWAAWLKGEYHD